MTNSRLAAALLASLACHAMMLALLKDGRRVEPPGATALVVALQATVAATAPVAALPQTATSQPGAAAGPLAVAKTPSDEEPGSAMSLKSKGSITYLIRYQQQVLGRSVQRWQHDGNLYNLNSQSEMLDANGALHRRSASSHGLVSAYGLLPVEFTGDSGQETLFFDRQRQTASSGDSGQTMAVAGDTQDELSLLYHLGQALLHGRALNSSSASAQGLTHQRFEALGSEDANLGGALRRVAHLRARDAAMATREVWISMDPQHLPLRILRRDELGREIEQVAQTID